MQICDITENDTTCCHCLWLWSHSKDSCPVLMVGYMQDGEPTVHLMLLVEVQDDTERCKKFNFWHRCHGVVSCCRMQQSSLGVVCHEQLKPSHLAAFMHPSVPTLAHSDICIPTCWDITWLTNRSHASPQCDRSQTPRRNAVWCIYRSYSVSGDHCFDWLVGALATSW